MLWWCLLQPANAESSNREATYAGIQLTEVDAFGHFYPQSHQQGWYTHVSNGLVFVYIAPDETLAMAWYDKQLETHKWRKPKALDGIGDSAAAVEDQLVIARFNNLGIISWCNENAIQWITYTEAITEKGTPNFPPPPTIEQLENERYQIQTTGVEFQYFGGTIDPLRPKQFLVPPSRLVVWDELGRSTEQYFSGTHPVPPPEIPENESESAH